MRARDQRGDPLSPHLEAIRLGAIIIPPVVSHVKTRCQARVASMQKPTPTSLMLRRMTASAVLDALRAGGPMTGSDLISATGLARPTVHVVCNDLIRLGWIREMDSRPPTGEARRGLPGRDIGPEIAGRHGWPVLLENDANLAARGERWRGVAAGVDDLVVMVADERLGSGLFLGGRPVRGHAGGAGELRFLEQIDRVGSTYGIAYLVRTLGAEAVDELALKIVDQVADRMAFVVAALAGMLNPELVVISGAVADDGDLFCDRIRARLLPDLIDTPPRLAMSTLGDQAVVTGAVRLALDHVEANLLGSPGATPWPEAPALAAAPAPSG